MQFLRISCIVALGVGYILLLDFMAHQKNKVQKGMEVSKIEVVAETTKDSSAVEVTPLYP